MVGLWRAPWGISQRTHCCLSHVNAKWSCNGQRCTDKRHLLSPAQHSTFLGMTKLSKMVAMLGTAAWMGRDDLVRFLVMCCHPPWVMWLFYWPLSVVWVAYPISLCPPGNLYWQLPLYRDDRLTGSQLMFPFSAGLITQRQNSPVEICPSPGERVRSSNCLSPACLSISGHVLLMASSNNKIFHLAKYDGLYD